MVSDIDDLLQLEESLAAAGEWLKQADVLIIADDGGSELAAALEGNPWSGFKSSGLQLEEARSPSLFKSQPRLAWGYWLSCMRACREVRPCPVQSLARDCTVLAPLGGYVMTTSIDGRWLRDGWPQDFVLELHGSLRRLQCSEPCSDDSWDMPRDLGLEEAPASGNAVGPLPKCPRCGAVARPCVRMGEDDAAFVGSRAQHVPAQEEAMYNRVEWCRGPSIVCLELGGTGRAPAYWEDLERRVAGLDGRLLRASMGPGAHSPHLESLVARGCAAVLPMRAPQVLQRCSAALGTLERASFVLADADRNGAELSMPSGTSLERLVWKACHEFHDRVCWEPHQELEAFVTNIEDTRSVRRLEKHESVPREFFTALREDQPRVAILEVRGVRFLGRNGRLRDRIHGTQCVLLDMNALFGSSQYQARLAQVKHQLELRNMIKEVHLSVLPKYGFHLTPETDLATTWRLQMRMQHSNQTSAVVEPEILALVSDSLQLSGMEKMGALPTVFQARAKKVEAVRRAPPADSKTFSPEHPRLKLFFGGWFGEERALSAFLEAPSEAVTAYLRDDPDGPFSKRVDAWPEGTEPPEGSRWSRWGFERDAKEFILKADWHAVPHLGTTADLFVPRLARKGKLKRAPKRYLAFAEAFRVANQPCWNAMVKALQDLKRAREDETLKASLAALEAGQSPPAERSGGDLVGAIIRAFVAQRHFGVFEAQVWWGEGPLKLPSHKDGATSLLHLGLTLGGRREVRLGAFRLPDASGPEGRWWEAGGKEDVWDEMAWMASGAQGQLRDVAMTRGCAYLSSPYVFEHGVEYQSGSWEEPVIALQCRLAFDAEPGKELNGLRDSVMRDVSNTIAKALCQASACGDLRMPGMEEILEAEARVPAIWKDEAAPRAAGG